MCTDASEGEFSQPALQQQANEMAHWKEGPCRPYRECTTS